MKPYLLLLFFFFSCSVTKDQAGIANDLIENFEKGVPEKPDRYFAENLLSPENKQRLDSIAVVFSRDIEKLRDGGSTGT